MHKSLLLLLTTYFFTISLNAQGNLSKRLEEFWNGNSAQWDLRQLDTWEYDAQDREIYHTHEDTFEDFFEFPAYKKSLRKTEYDDYGNILFQLNRQYNDTAYFDYRRTNTYDTDQQLIERLEQYENGATSQEYLSEVKSTFTYNEIARTQLEQYETRYQMEDWILNHKSELFFDENDCQIREEHTSLYPDNIAGTRNWNVWTRDEDCRVLTRERWREDDDSDEMEKVGRGAYEYLNDGLIERYMEEELSNDEWELRYQFENEFDEEGRSLHRYSEYLSGESVYKQLVTYTYNEKGEQTSSNNYRNYDWLGELDLKLYIQDTAVYEYNTDDQLVKKVQTINRYDENEGLVFSATFTTTYEYYCNGQLKRETLEALPEIIRITYEYDEKAPCAMEIENPSLTVFSESCIESTFGEK